MTRLLAAVLLVWAAAALTYPALTGAHDPGRGTR